MIDTSLALDSKGNILVVAYADSGPTFPSYGNSVASRLAEFNNLGAPITPATTLNGGNVVFGGVLPYPQYYLVSSSNLSAVAVDQTGNIWLSDDPSGNLFELSPDLALLNPVSPANPAGTGRGVDSIAIDTSSNNWLGTGTGLLFEFDHAANQILATDATQPYLSLNSMTFDSNGGLWGADYVGQDTYQINTTDGTLLFDAFGNGNGYDYVTLVADGSGNVYGCAEAGGQVLDVFNSRALKNSFAIGSQNNQRGCGTQLVLDGQGHIFAVSNTAATNVPLIAVDEFTTSGAAISPASGYTGTSPGEPPTINPDYNVFPIYEYPGTTAGIDSSGNLWVLNNDTNGVDVNLTPVPGNVLVEFVGIGAPVVTPTSVALQNGQLGSRP